MLGQCTNECMAALSEQNVWELDSNRKGFGVSFGVRISAADNECRTLSSASRQQQQGCVPVEWSYDRSELQSVLSAMRAHLISFIRSDKMPPVLLDHLNISPQLSPKMSSPLHSNAPNDGTADAIQTTSNAQQSETMPRTGASDSEAQTGIEMTAGGNPSAQQKRDDPYLVCFDEVYDAEKYGVL